MGDTRSSDLECIAHTHALLIHYYRGFTTAIFENVETFFAAFARTL